MILFLYGEENYLSYQKLLGIKKKYIDASLGTTNLVELDGNNLEYKTFCRQVSTLPFLAKTRLVIIKNLLSSKKKKIEEQILSFLSQIPKTTVLIFYEDKMPDKRSAMFKKLLKIAIAQEFKKLSPLQLRTWINKQINVVSDIKKDEIVNLLEKSSDNMWQLTNEIEKICLFLEDNQHATIEELSLLTNLKLENNIFIFLETLASKNIQKSVNALHNLLMMKVNELYILTMINYEFRQILMISDCVAERKNITQIVQITHLNPYIVRKNYQLAQKYSSFEIKKIYDDLMQADIMIKTGQISPVLALDLLVAKICM